ncbi:hypothetical protein ACI8AF_00305 [Blastococcus sp. SYSU D00669]
MSLLSRLAAKIDKLNTELAATEALGLILTDAEAADVVSAVVRTVAPHLPDALRYTTQEAGEEGRPDIVGSADRREVLHIEGKFWAGLTPAQARGAYLDRMRRQHASHAPDDPHVGALLFVVPPRRVATLMDELTALYSLTDRRTAAAWWWAQTADGMTIAVTSWEELLSRITGAADQSVAEDARQLLDLVQQVDHHSFIPWSDEQRTDQDVPRRILRLATMVEAIHRRLQSSGVATPTGRRQTITGGGHLAFGKRMRLGGVVVTLRVSLQLWARHGRSPLWLSFSDAGAPVARRAFPGDLIEADDWAVLPVPLPVGKLEDETLELLTAWLIDAGQRLRAALGGDAPPDDDGDELDPDDASGQ